MNLYKIVFSHHAPKDREEGIKALILAENDEQVYNWIASEPETAEGPLHNNWKDREINFPEEESFKQRMLELQGELYDDYVDFSDSYYGITLLGWELLKENVTTDYSELIELGIMFIASEI